MNRFILPAFLAVTTLLALAALRPAEAATFRVSETYRFELFNFSFDENFWAGSFPDLTDAATPVPIERVTMSFRADYLSPVATALKFRPNAAVEIAFLDFEMVTRDVPGLSVAQTLGLADLTSPQFVVRPDRDGKTVLVLGGPLTGGGVSHRFGARLPDLELLARGSEGLGATFSVFFDSLKPFDAPDYIVRGNRVDLVGGVQQETWQTTLLSQSAVPAPVPLPAAGLMLAGALAGLGAAAARRTRAPRTACPTGEDR